MSVLLVDDEEKFVSRLAERLAIRGIKADWVTSAEAALEKVEETSYDVAVLDVKMPRMGGIELRKKLAGMNPDMRFILVTGHGSGEDFEAGSAEAEYYIIKPFKIEFLIEKLKEILGDKIP